MCKILLIFLSCCLFPLHVMAGTLSGTVRGILAKQNSPYIVVADITLLPGDSLRIEPGVELRFEEATSFLVKGRLTAVGAATDSIRFSSNLANPAPGNWNGIFITSSDSTRLSFLVVRYAAVGVTFNGTYADLSRSSIAKNNTGIDCVGGAHPRIFANALAGNLNAGIRSISAAPEIRANVIKENSLFGFESAVVLERSDALLAQNFILDNGNSGIDLVECTAPRLLQNTIARNGLGITLTNSSPQIINNIVALNSSGISADAGQVEATHNDVWGNTGGNYYNMPAGIGVNIRRNARGDSVDVFFNLQINPAFKDAGGGDFRIQPGSPCIDAGDSTNPAGVSVIGGAPDIGAHENDELPTPVELVSFQYFEGRLLWQTSSETNNYGFFVEAAGARSGPFEVLGFVPGNGTTTVPHGYEFVPPGGGDGRYYRLRQVDFDGTATYSGVIFGEGLPRTADLVRSYPNPFYPVSRHAGGRLTILFGGDRQVRGAVRVFDLTGRRIKTLAPAPGERAVMWDGRNEAGVLVAPGTYFYAVTIDGRRVTKKVAILP